MQPQVPVAVMFVDAAAPRAGADGTREHPFSSIGEALNVAPPGALVRVAEGTYEETVEIRANVTINGAGAAKTRIVGTRAMHGALVRISAERVELSDLAVENGDVGVAIRGGSVRLASVALRDHAHAALVARDADVAIARGELARIAGGVQGYGIEIDGGTLDLRSTTFNAAGRRAIEVRRAKASVRDVDVAGSAVSALQAVDGAEVTVEGGRFAALGGPALYVGGARLVAVRAYVRDAEYGIVGFRGARVEARSVDVADTRIAGIALVVAGGFLSGCTISRAGTDAAVAITNPPEPVRLENNRIVAPGPMGVHVTFAKVVLEGNAITGARLDPGGDLGDGIYAVDSELQLERNLLRANAGSGITATRSNVDMTENDVGGNARAGLVLLDGSEASLRGNAFEENGGPGVVIAERSRAMLAANRFVRNREVHVDQVCGGAGRVELRSGNRFLGPAVPRRRCP
jgi:Right handed beta helix region/Protein of unknown function (DUF1565)